MIDNRFEFYLHQRKNFDPVIRKEKVQRSHFPTILPHFCINFYGSKSLIFPYVHVQSHSHDKLNPNPILLASLILCSGKASVTVWLRSVMDLHLQIVLVLPH